MTKKQVLVVALQVVNPHVATTREQLVENIVHACNLIRSFHRNEQSKNDNMSDSSSCPVLYVLCELSSCTYDEKSFVAPLDQVTELFVEKNKDGGGSSSCLETEILASSDEHCSQSAPSFYHFSKLAKELECFVCFGFQRRLNGDQRTVAQCVMNNNGLVELVYNKQHLCSFGDCREDKYFVRGDCNDSDLCFDMPQGIRVGMSICYDFRFPEHFRRLARLGCDLVLHPASFPLDEYSSSWPMFSTVRALENQFYVLTVNMLGNSMVTPPWLIPNRLEVKKLGDAKNDFLSFVVDGQIIEQMRTEVPLRRDSGLDWKN